MARVVRIALDVAISTTKGLKSRLSIAWQYAKVEIAPPMTVGLLHGPIGKKLEDAVSSGVDSFIGALQGKINAIEAEAARKKKAEEDAIKAEQEKIKSEAKAKEAAKQKELADKLAKDAKEAKEKAKTEAKPEAKAEVPEAEKKEPAKKEEPKPKKK